MLTGVGAGDPRPTNLYRHYDSEGTLLYIGVSLNAIVRLSQHKTASGWFEQISRVEIEKFPSRAAALNAETEAIKREDPLHNVRLVATPPHPSHVAADRVSESREYLLGRVVEYHPLYSVDDLCRVLDCRPALVRQLIQSRELGHVLIPSRNGTGKVRQLVTGWQLIDYLEKAQSDAVSAGEEEALRRRREMMPALELLASKNS